jgi:hypothetical protein
MTRPEPPVGARGRRALLDEARRKVERSLAISEVAAELVRAAEATLAAARAGQVEVDQAVLDELSAAVAKYRELERSF